MKRSTFENEKEHFSQVKRGINFTRRGRNKYWVEKGLCTIVAFKDYVLIDAHVQYDAIDLTPLNAPWLVERYRTESDFKYSVQTLCCITGILANWVYLLTLDASNTAIEMTASVHRAIRACRRPLDFQRSQFSRDAALAWLVKDSASCWRSPTSTKWRLLCNVR